MQADAAAAATSKVDRLFAAHASDRADGYDAASEVIERVASDLPGADAILLAATVGYAPGSIGRALREKSWGLPLIGASAMSVVGDAGWLERGVAAIGIRHRGGRTTVGSVSGLRGMSPGAFADAVARAVPEGSGSTLLVFFTDVLIADYGSLLRTLGAARPDLTACGACSVFDASLAPPDPRFLADWQALGGSLTSDTLVFAAFEGAAIPGRTSCSFAHGFAQIGTPARVTRAAGDVIHEVDGNPAREHFRKYIGGEDLRIDGYANLLCFSISRAASGISTPQYSLPLEFLQDGAVRVLNAVPAGSEIALCSTTRRDLVEAARDAAASVRSDLAAAGGRPGALLLFSCAGRQLALGRRCAREVAAVRGAFDARVPAFGFYSGGEFAPDPDPSAGGASIYNAYSATVLAFAGRDGGSGEGAR